MDPRAASAELWDVSLYVSLFLFPSLCLYPSLSLSLSLSLYLSVSPSLSPSLSLAVHLCLSVSLYVFPSLSVSLALSRFQGLIAMPRGHRVTNGVSLRHLFSSAANILRILSCKTSLPSNTSTA